MHVMAKAHGLSYENGDRLVLELEDLKKRVGEQQEQIRHLESSERTIKAAAVTRGEVGPMIERVKVLEMGFAGMEEKVSKSLGLHETKLGTQLGAQIRELKKLSRGTYDGLQQEMKKMQDRFETFVLNPSVRQADLDKLLPRAEFQHAMSSFVNREELETYTPIAFGHSLMDQMRFLQGSFMKHMRHTEASLSSQNSIITSAIGSALNGQAPVCNS